MLIAEQRGTEFTDLRPDQDMRDTFRQNRALLFELRPQAQAHGAGEGDRTRDSGSYCQRPSRCCASLGSAGEDIIKDVTGRWSAKVWQRNALWPATSFIERTRPSASSVACSIKGLAATSWANRVRLVIDGVDGRVHHIEMDAAHAEDVGRGMIVVAGAALLGRAPPTVM